MTTPAEQPAASDLTQLIPQCEGVKRYRAEAGIWTRAYETYRAEASRLGGSTSVALRWIRRKWDSAGMSVPRRLRRRSNITELSWTESSRPPQITRL